MGGFLGDARIGKQSALAGLKKAPLWGEIGSG